MQFEHIFVFVFGLVVAIWLFKVIRNRGFRGAMFGAPLRRLASEMELANPRRSKTNLKTYILEPREASAGPHVGIEVTAWRGTGPIALTREEAQRLADQLTIASRESADVGTHG